MWKVLGVMSGSSLDGLDVALCAFDLDNGTWSASIQRARTIAYAPGMHARLAGAMGSDALELARLHRDLGDLIGGCCKELAEGEEIDLIGSHGHTVFHKPEEGLTMQIGCGARIAAACGKTTVCDFRTKDVAFGGQGAPLVPLGERLLFPDNDAFLNLGGISNASFHLRDGTSGYDIGPCNMLLNMLALEMGSAFDEDGRIAASGMVHAGLLAHLESLPFYRLPPPRSLGREWFEEHMRRPMQDKTIPLPDRMRTAVEHIALRIGAELDSRGIARVLVTGGGAHNAFLISRLRELTKADVVVPQRSLVDFKEAMIFALLGLLRVRGEVNALASVTGARRDSVGGAVFLPN